MVKVVIGPFEATIDAGVWESPNRELAGMLQGMHPQGVSTAWPNRDLRQAQEVVEQLGGTITYVSPNGDAPPDDVIY